MNMARPANLHHLEPYRTVLQKWMPKTEIRPAGNAWTGFDGVVTWRATEGTIRYLVVEKRHFRHQDVGVVADQLTRRRTNLRQAKVGDRILLLAPHVRLQQAAILERAAIDYLDLAGNAHLNAPGLFVHVEGHRPPKEPAAAPGRPHRGWIKTVMALLVHPDLVTQPYRVLAERADVALGTVAKCFKDLIVRGLLYDGKRGRRLTDRQALVALWIQAYIEALRPKLEEQRLQVRAEGKQEIWERLDAVLRPPVGHWALTGADAAERRTHFYRAEETEIYAPPRMLADRVVQKALMAQPTVHGGNLLVIEPPGAVAIPAGAVNGIPVAPHLLVYAELRHRGTGQALEAAEMFLPYVLDDGTH